MNKYTVYVPYPTVRVVRGVMAEDEEAAIDRVQDPFESLCSSCAEYYDLVPDADGDNSYAVLEDPA